MLRTFAPDARDSVERAIREAADRGAASVEAEHLLLALTGTGGAAQRALAAFGLDREGVEDALDLEWARSLAAAGIGGSPPPRRAGAATAGTIPLSPSAKLALQRSLDWAALRRERRITTGHLLLGLLGAEAGTVPRALDAANVDAEALQGQVEAELDYPVDSE